MMLPRDGAHRAKDDVLASIERAKACAAWLDPALCSDGLP